MLYPTLSQEDQLTLKPADNFYAALQAAGLPAVPREFAVVPQHQIIPSNTMAEICEFIRVFDRLPPERLGRQRLCARRRQLLS